MARKIPQNFNHPKKGSRIAVDPVRQIKDVKAIGKMLESKPRDYLLWVLGTNNGLRISDLLRLKAGDLMDLKPGDTLRIIESKTGKENILMINRVTYKALQNFFSAVQPDEDSYIFRSQKGNNQALSVQACNNKIKSWCRQINLRGNYGCHTLRKTWAYQQRVQFGVGFELIAKRMNHSSPSVTMRYLGIEDKEVNGILLNNEIG